MSDIVWDKPSSDEGIQWDSPEEDKSPSLSRFSDKSFGGRVGDVAAGLFEPAVSMVFGAPAFVEGTARKGIQYAKEALTNGITPDTEGRATKASQDLSSVSKFLQYEPRTETGKLGMEGLDNIFQWIIKGGGTGVAGIEQIRRKLVGQEQLSQEDFEIVKNLGSLGLEVGMAAGAVKGGVDVVRGIRRGKEEPTAKPSDEIVWDNVDTTKYNQTEMPFMDERLNVRPPYDVLPEAERARLENELNPPVDPMRVGGQGELFTEERAYQPGEQVERFAEPPVRSARERPEPYETENRPVEPMDPITLSKLKEEAEGPYTALDVGRGPRLTEVGEMEGRQGLPYEPMGKQAGERPLEFTPPDTPLPPPDLTPVFRGPGRRQRGAINPDILTLGIPKLLETLGLRGTMEKFKGAYNPHELDTVIRANDNPKARSFTVMMKPDDFHRMAYRRSNKEMINDIARKKRDNIRKGLEKPEGLDEVPRLTIEPIYEDGHWTAQVVSHEGRHRMDVFKQKGIEQVPVELRFHTPQGYFREEFKKGVFSGDINIEKLIGEDISRWHPRDEGNIPKPEIRFPKISKLDDSSLDFTQKLAMPFRGPGRRQAGAVMLEQSKKNIQKNPGAKTLDNALKMFAFDRRATPKQVLEDAGIKIQKTPDESANLLKDISSNDLSAKSRFERLIKQGMTNTMVDRAMAVLTQDRGPIGKLIKWVVDQQNLITRDSRVAKEENIRVALAPWRQLRKVNSVELQEALKIWQDNVTKPLSRLDFKTDRQWEVFKAVNETLTDQLNRVNKERELSSSDNARMEPIEPIESFFPAMREGDYWVKMFDKAGKEVHAEAFTNQYAAQFAYKKMKETFPELDVREPFLRPKGKYELSTFEAFEETLRSLDRKDPIREMIQRRMATLRQHRGFAKHGLHREGIGGAMGYEGGPKGLKRAEYAIETYIAQSEAYMANLQKARVQSKLDGLPQWVRDKAPLAMQYIDQYMSKSRGADLDKLGLVRDLTEAMSTSIGFGRNGPRAFIHHTASLASLLWLATIRFATVQLPQHLLSLPKLDQLRGLGADIPNKVTAWFDGMKESFSPDAISKEARQWALNRGLLESTIVKLMEDRLSNLKGENSGVIPEVVKWGFGKLEQKAVRVPAFHIFEKNLRSTVADKETRFEMAANMMDHYMTHYDRESAPLVYDKLGLVGEVARPLKQYAHNNFGQFFEYTQGVVNHGELKPLASFIGLQALTGGLKGIVGVSEATAAIALINAMFSLDIPSPEQMMYKYLSGVADWIGLKGKTKSTVLEALVYGGYSTVMGRDVSGSLAAPAIPQLFEFAPAEFTVNAFASVGNYLVKKLKGESTDQDAMKAMLAISPAQMKGWIEYLYSNEGGVIPNPNQKMKGNFPVPDNTYENFVRFGLGMKSLDEAKWNAMVRSAKQLLSLDAQEKISAIDAIADRVINGQDIPEDLLQQYMENGGSVSGLKRAIKAQILGRQLTWPEGVLRQKSATPMQAHKLQRLREMMDEELDNMLNRGGKSEPQSFLEGDKGTVEPAGFFGFGSDKSKMIQADDGSKATVKRGFRENEQKQQALDSMQERAMQREARRLFPNDKEKQEMWMFEEEQRAVGQRQRLQNEMREKMPRQDIKRYM